MIASRVFESASGAFFQYHEIVAIVNALNAEDASARKDASSSLDNEIAALQGDLLEAAYFVIDLVVSLLKNPCKDYAVVLDLLVELALGAAPESRTFVDELGQTRMLHEACRTKFKSYRSFFESLSLPDQASTNLKADLIEAIDNFDIVDSEEFKWEMEKFFKNKGGNIYNTKLK